MNFLTTLSLHSLSAELAAQQERKTLREYLANMKVLLSFLYHLFYPIILNLVNMDIPTPDKPDVRAPVMP